MQIGDICFDDADDFFKDGLEVFPSVGAEGSGDVFPDHKPRSAKVYWSSVLQSVTLSHLLHNANLFHEKPGPFSGKASSSSRNAQILTNKVNHP